MSKDNMKRIIRWILIVSANAILGLFLAIELAGLPLTGMLLGITTWMVVYIALDFYLIKQGHITLSKKLTISTCLRIPLQLFMGIDYVAGMAAAFTMEVVFGFYPDSPIVEAYLLTVLTGVYLSLVCAVILLLLYVIPTLFRGSNKRLV